ncbi:peptidylprolyl isomerase [Chryseobacterium sp. SN22]|uniref:peptidylprolyl isomerase n=1 Tax=Chryseobacterium sp. SN22 TaxID=2606431 RepID=UPI0011EDE13E|nr:peptidylprolyl isomerase [Chryseobacterium sp. SN22]KAA0126569.1 peptidylprolyl isomerase [Chryseobacterium sp. SN22]
MKKIVAVLTVLAFHLGFSQGSQIKIVESKKIELTSELSKDQIAIYNQSFIKFVAALKDSDKQAVNGLISDKVKDIVSDDMIRKLFGGISFERKTEVYKSGYQKLLDNATYPAIQYKYADDPSDPPRDIITVIFENDGKILGVKPEYSK